MHAYDAAAAALPRARRWAPELHTLLVAVVGCMALRICLDYALRAIVRELFTVESTQDVDLVRLIESYAWTLVLATAAAAGAWRSMGVASTVELLYLSFVILPALTLLASGGEIVPAAFIRVMAVSFIVLVVMRRIVPDLRITQVGNMARILCLAAAVLITIYVYAGLIATGGLSRLNFDLASVYLVREELEVNALPLGGYLIAWQAHVINMLAFAFALYRRRWLLAALIIAAHLFLFGMTNYKSFLLAPVLVAAFTFMIGSPRRVLFGILLGAVAGILMAQVLYALTDELLIPALFVRRLFFQPAEMHFWYYDFFSQPDHPFVLLSNSILSWLSDYPYPRPVVSMISWAYLGMEEGANVGWLADAYAQFGFAGMIGFSILLALLLKVVDAVSARVPMQIACGAIAVPAFSLVNSGLLTSMLTHGLLVAILSLWVLGARRGGAN